MSNSLKMELGGKHVLLKKEDGYGPDLHKRLFLCTAGFGCSSFTRGTCLMVERVYDGAKGRAEGYEVDRLATEEEVKTVRDMATDNAKAAGI